MTSNPRMQAESGDAAQRALVLDPRASFIVQAPAGSGKTELLIQRYLRLLADSSVLSPESVLAITFTKKAAAEMRNRVLAALQSAAAEAPEQPHERLSWNLAKAVAARDHELGWKLLQNPERLEIRTVDAFCEKIVNRTPLLAGIGQKPSIAADFAALYAEASQRTLMLLGDGDEATRAAITQVLLDQDNRLDRVQKLLVQLLERREQWLRILGRSDRLAESDYAELRRDLEKSLRDAIASELRKVRASIQRLLSQDQIAELLRYARHGAENLAGEESELACLRDLYDLPGAAAQDRALWQGLREFCLTKKPQFRAEFDKRRGFSAGQEKEDCTLFFRNLAQAPIANELCAALSRIDRLPPETYSEGEWKSLLALFRVLPLAVANLRVVFGERGEVDHSEVAMAATSALGERGHPTDLGFHLGYKIQHLLVDEFQDTSVAQTELLERLIQAWSPESGTTLFVVGDPMQSIYGFRQAEVALFLRAQQNGFGEGEWPLQNVTLTANFRSRPKLVKWFNDVFPHVLQGNDEVTGAVQYKPSQAVRERANPTGVEFHSTKDKDYVGEAARVVAIVREELSRDSHSIAILVRSRTHLVEIAPALQQAKIPFRAKEIHVLAERQTVRDLHAFAQAMLHLGDRTAWLAILRGPWCGLSLADLWELCRGDRKSTVWELLTSRSEKLSPSGQRAIARILPSLSAAVERRGRVSLRALVESLWISIGGPASLAGDEVEAKMRDAEAYLALLQKLEAQGDTSEKRLENELKALYAPSDTNPGVRVELMTIHSAKGLQFDTVILPGLNRGTDRNKTQLLNWRERVIGDRRDLLLAPKEPAGPKSESATIAKYIMTVGADCSGEESRRLLYVATTRAKERLHLVTTLPEDRIPRQGSLLALLPEHVVAQFPELESSSQLPISWRRTVRLRRLPEDWVLPAPPAAVRVAGTPHALRPAEARKHTFVRVGEDLRRIGTVTHRVLQQIGEEGVESWNAERIAKLGPSLRAMLMQEGVRDSELSSSERRIRKALENTLADDTGRWILQKRATSNNEYGLTALVDSERVSIKVDRTFVDDETRWLIDYKTSDQEGTITESYLQEQIDKYRDDLTRYARILHQLDGRTVKGGLYFPLLQRWRSIEFPS